MSREKWHRVPCLRNPQKNNREHGAQETFAAARSKISSGRGGRREAPRESIQDWPQHQAAIIALHSIGAGVEKPTRKEEGHNSRWHQAAAQLSKYFPAT